MVSSNPDQSQVLDIRSLIIGEVEGTGGSGPAATINTEKTKPDQRPKTLPCHPHFQYSYYLYHAFKSLIDFFLLSTTWFSIMTFYKSSNSFSYLQAC